MTWGSIAIVAFTLTVAVRVALKATAVPAPDQAPNKAEAAASPEPHPVPAPAPPISNVPPVAAPRVGGDAGTPAPEASVGGEVVAKPDAEPVQRIHIRGTEKPASASATPDRDENTSDGPDAGSSATIDREGIRTAIRAITPLVKDCYEAELARTPAAAGSIQVKFNIVSKDGKGRIDEASIMEESTLNGFELQSCVLHELSKANFPMPAGDGEIVVHYPFKFSSETEK